MVTTVVHCKRDQYDTYIGRGSKWGNPFKVGVDGDREEVIEKYRQWILTQPKLLEALPELQGKALGCWCSPKSCHGDVLIELIEGGNMNEMPDYIVVEEREEQLDSVNDKNDTLRIVYRISTARVDPSEEALKDICEHLIEREDTRQQEYRAIAFFFWKDGMAIGEVPALASLTYAPGGSWDMAFAVDRTDLPPMQLVVDFNNYTECADD